MIIRELEITGFKSFATKTRIRLEHSTTAVVGPNGCGKSNILDALKWVLGEKSVKSIRGEKMEDVIFSGTETKKPANFAEVSLLIDNAGRTLGIDSDTVRIGRRLYRDGQSHYFINDARVTRRDVEHLLMDTGLGKSSYSFMEQGRMDMILSSKPEERRYIFEEAAGISRFKAQKEEAEKNLENAQLNITRLQDILHELERELKVKEAQAKKTEIYNRLLKEQREHDLKIRYITLIELERNLADLRGKLEKKLAEREKIQQRLIQYEQKIQQIDEEQLSKREELHQKDIANQLGREKISNEEKRLTEIESRRIELQQQKDNLKLQISRLEKRVKELRQDLDRQNQLTLQLNVRLEDAEKALQENAQQSDRLLQAIHEAEKQLGELKEKQRLTAEELRSLREKLEVVIRDLLASLKSEKTKWQQTEKEHERTKEKTKKSIFQLLDQLSTIIEKSGAAPEKALKEIDVRIRAFNREEFSANLDGISAISDSLRHLLFEKGGIHSQKEEIDELITSRENLLIDIEKERNELLERISRNREELEEKRRQREIIHGDIRSFNVQRDSIAERERNLNQQIENEEKSLHFFIAQYKKVDSDIIACNNEQKIRLNEIEKMKSSIAKELARIELLEKALGKNEQKKAELHDQIKKENEKNADLFSSITETEVQIGTLLGSQEIMLQDIYNDYNLTMDEIRDQIGEVKIQLQAEKSRLSEIRKEIEALGPINPLAIEELRTVQELYNHNENQLKDILKAKEDIMSVLQDIQQKSEKLFMESFNLIQQNFSEIFKRLFRGGNVVLTLLEPEKPLESGIEIQAEPPGKRPKSLRLLSGGERTLTAIALMFGIYMVRSSPLCVMDEIDAPLDDQNVTRFLNLIDDFESKTQFILITHHKKTMARAQAIFGVTMEEPGVSRLLSVELKREEKPTG